jgi:hypothetical protein
MHLVRLICQEISVSPSEPSGINKQRKTQKFYLTAEALSKAVWLCLLVMSLELNRAPLQEMLWRVGPSRLEQLSPLTTKDNKLYFPDFQSSSTQMDRRRYKPTIHKSVAGPPPRSPIGKGGLSNELVKPHTPKKLKIHRPGPNHFPEVESRPIEFETVDI